MHNYLKIKSIYKQTCHSSVCSLHSDITTILLLTSHYQIFHVVTSGSPPSPGDLRLQYVPLCSLCAQSQTHQITGDAKWTSGDVRPVQVNIMYTINKLSLIHYTTYQQMLYVIIIAELVSPF